MGGGGERGEGGRGGGGGAAGGGGARGRDVAGEGRHGEVHGFGAQFDAVETRAPGEVDAFAEVRAGDRRSQTEIHRGSSPCSSEGLRVIETIAQGVGGVMGAYAGSGLSFVAKNDWHETGTV